MLAFNPTFSPYQAKGVYEVQTYGGVLSIMSFDRAENLLPGGLGPTYLHNLVHVGPLSLLRKFMKGNFGEGLLV